MCLLQSEFQKRVLSPSPQKKSTFLTFKYWYFGTGHSSSDKCLVCSLCSACSFSTKKVLTAVTAMIGAANRNETFFQVAEEASAWCSTASMCLANSAPLAGSAVNAGLSRLDWNLLPITFACLFATVLNIVCVCVVCLCVYVFVLNDSTRACVLRRIHSPIQHHKTSKNLSGSLSAFLPPSSQSPSLFQHTTISRSSGPLT